MEVKKLGKKGASINVKLYSRRHFNVTLKLNEITHTESSTCESNVSQQKNITRKMTLTNSLQLLQKNACEKIHDN